MKFRHIFITIFTFLVIILPNISLAEGVPFKPLVGIPGFNPDDVNGLGFGTYINTLYRLSISLAALLAVVKIVMAGAKYMLSDIVTYKEEAKNDIKGALVGLLIIIGAVLILNTVNTDITKNTIAIDRVNSDVSADWKKDFNNILARLNEASNFCEVHKNCTTLTCEGWVTDSVEVKDGEDVVAACARACKTDLKGVYVPNTMGISGNGSGGFGLNTGIKSATCTYDAEEAAKCDPDSSVACCNIHSGTWYTEHQKCSTEKRPLNIIECTDYLGSVATKDCTEEIKSCNSRGNVVVSTYDGSPLTWSNTYGVKQMHTPSILCEKSVDGTNPTLDCSVRGQMFDPVSKKCVEISTNEKNFPSEYYFGRQTDGELTLECARIFGNEWKYNPANNNCTNL